MESRSSGEDASAVTKDQIFEFFRRLAEDNPNPETELEYGNAYQLVVAVALSAQATDVGVNKATRALFAKVDNPQAMLDLGLEGLIAHIKTIGLFNSKAKTVIALWFGQETFAVDTHIFRVGNRTGLAKGKTPEKVEEKLEKRVPQPFRLGAHHWLILHGRYICKARTPECWQCKVVDLCSHRKKVLEKPKGR